MLATRDVDGRTDIWALGATLYELTTAQVPFPGDYATQVAALVMTAAPIAPSRLNPEVPAALDRVIMRCLERDLSRRIGTIAELVEALSPLAVAQPAPVVAASHATDDEDDGSTLMLPAGSSPSRPSHDDLSGSGTWAAAAPHPAVPAPSPSWPRASSPSGPGLPGPPPPAMVAPYLPAPSPSGPGTMALPAPAAGISAPIGPVAPPASTTAAALSSTAPHTRPSGSGVPLALGVIGLLLCGSIGAAWLALRTPAGGTAPGTTPPDALAPPTAVAAASSVAAPPSASPEETAEAATTAQPVVTPAAERAAPAPAPPPTTAPPKTAPAVQQARPSAPPASAAPPPVPKKPAVNCNPPFIVDAQGVKRAKPECL
jgi:serine/threonine-protein kinase